MNQSPSQPAPLGTAPGGPAPLDPGLGGPDGPTAPPRPRDRALLGWCALVTLELVVLAGLTGWSLWLLLGIALYWPVRDALSGDSLPDPEPEPATGPSGLADPAAADRAGALPASPAAPGAGR